MQEVETGSTERSDTLISRVRQRFGLLGRSGRRLEPPFRRQVILVGCIGLVLLVVLWSLHAESVTPIDLVLEAVALAVMAGPLRWWWGHRRLFLAILIDVALVSVYLWSLGDATRITIHVAPTHITATVDRTTVTLDRRVSGRRLGLVTASDYDFEVGPQGPAGTTGSSLPARIEEHLRFAVPQAAWKDVRLVSDGRLSSILTYVPNSVTGTWSRTPRGELQGSPGASFVVTAPGRGAYTLIGDLMRADGTQAIPIGVNRAGVGYVLYVRADAGYLTWGSWNNGSATVIKSAYYHSSIVAAVQRALRIILANVIAAFVIILIASVAYLVLVAIFRLLRVDTTTILAVHDRWVRSSLLGWATIGLGAVAFIGASYFALRIFDGLPHLSDSLAYLFQAKTYALGLLAAPVPKFETFFNFDMVLTQHGHWFSKYPPGWPILLAIGVELHAPWLINPLLTAGIVTLTYRIVLEMYGRVVALVAALLTATSPYILILGGSLEVHTASLFYLSVFVYLTVRWNRRGGVAWRSLVPAGFFLGMCFITRELDAVAIGACVCLLAPAPRLSRVVRSCFWTIVGTIGPLVAYGAYLWYLTGSPFANLYTLYLPFDRLGFGSTVGPNGYWPADGIRELGTRVEFLMANVFGWPFYAAVALAFIPFILGRASKWDRLAGISMLAVMVAYVFYWGADDLYGGRYYYVLTPFLALLVVRGLQELTRLVQALPVPRARNRGAAVGGAMVGVALLVTYNLGIYLPAQRALYRAYNGISSKPLALVQHASIHNALVFAPDNRGRAWWIHNDVFSQNTPLLNSDVIFAGDRGRKDVLLERYYPRRAVFRLTKTSLIECRSESAQPRRHVRNAGPCGIR